MVLGLTGVMGSGKSTVRRLLEASGFRGIDCDVVVRELLEGDDEVRGLLTARWGSVVFDAVGHVDRAAVSAIVFRDDEERCWLESVLHPRVRAYWQSKVQEDLDVRWVVEVPLLFENNLEFFFDFTACVSCSPDTQLKRLLEKGFSEVDVKARMASQLSIQEKVKRSDFVLFNDGDEVFLRDQVELLIQVI